MEKSIHSELPAAMSRLVRWDQQEAKAKFSEVVRRALGEGPQLVMTRGTRPVVVLSAEIYAALTENRPVSFSDLLAPGDDFTPARADAPVDYTPFSM